MEEPYDLDDMDEEALEALGFLRPEANAIIRAGSVEGWSFAIQASTSYVSARNYLPTLSQGTRVVAVTMDVNITQRVEYAVDGRVLSSFDPIFPGDDIGADPSALAWPAGEPMDPAEVLEQTGARFGLWVPQDSENQRLPAAALSSSCWCGRRRGGVHRVHDRRPPDARLHPRVETRFLRYADASPAVHRNAGAMDLTVLLIAFSVVVILATAAVTASNEPPLWAVLVVGLCALPVSRALLTMPAFADAVGGSALAAWCVRIAVLSTATAALSLVLRGVTRKRRTGAAG